MAAMFREHPYEEVAYDISPLQNENKEYGLGAIGEFLKPISQDKLLSLIKKAFGTPFLRYTGKSATMVKKIAVCGGAGGELVSEAIRQHADAYITADVKYHGFQDAERDILLIDAGHFETEYPILPILAQRLKEIVKKEGAPSKVFITKKNTNPVSYY
jgi:putative NIF3 family GTP cyclohydrolase 1 type 2